MLRLCLLFLATALCVLTPAQIPSEKKPVVVNGHSGEVALGRINGHACIDLEDLVRVANGSLGLQGDQISLTLPAASAKPPAPTIDAEAGSHTALSQGFVKAGIETNAELRELAAALAYMIQNGYGVTEQYMTEQRQQTGHTLNLAKVAASAPPDKDALQLLNNQFNAVWEWSDKLYEARKSMDTAKYAISSDALRNEPASQKIIRCSRFLDQMLVSGEYQDDVSCH